ncbi:50S ribosomal protein L11 [Pirellula sp. SH-Sr6A]|uniref:50S ribosomal protein L11 n=1 Tax=Pirellula sp. SH-Sr6A TaxID=1632865 RepID=UPI00078E411C|nr:50S ribosomal protein L11 [Pirellula sp. SH-Sr6A]AMV34207.1 50S ribosomal protein L11 [Pirellula sp. SH-Sr6A]
MAKQVVGKAAFQVPGGKATPAPPVGTSLGKFGINLGQFVSQFNDRTREFNGTPIPVVVTVYSDRSFEFITKSPPASALLKMAAGIASGSGEPHKVKVGKVSRDQVDDICKKKMADLNARDLEHARRMIEGTARSMGIEIVG